MARVNSTAIERVGPSIRNKFRLRFRGGREYVVFAPREVRRALRHAESPGRYFNDHVKGRHAIVRVER